MPGVRSFLFLFNIAKNSNFGYLIRTANAFAAEPIVIGRRSYRTWGAVGGTRHTPVHRFYTFDEGVEFVRREGCRISGIEILPQAQSICDRPFQGPTAFMIGNEGEGLSQRQIDVCDDFIYVPQYGTAVSLNINAAAAIVLQHFAVWSGHPECPREGDQFQSGHSAHTSHQEFARRQ